MPSAALKRADKRRPTLKLVRGHVAAPPEWKTHPEFGLCRTLTGHAWKEATQIRQVKDDVIVRLACDRCEATRQDYVSFRSGMVLSRSYHYVKGYQQKIGQGQQRPAKSEMRRTYLHMLLGK